MCVYVCVCVHVCMNVCVCVCVCVCACVCGMYVRDREYVGVGGGGRLFPFGLSTKTSCCVPVVYLAIMLCLFSCSLTVM